jgi:hypothetical protein
MKVTRMTASRDMSVTVHNLERQLAQERAQRLRLETQLGGERSANTKLRLALIAARAEVTRLRAVTR